MIEKSLLLLYTILCVSSSYSTSNKDYYNKIAKNLKTLSDQKPEFKDLEARLANFFADDVVIVDTNKEYKDDPEMVKLDELVSAYLLEIKSDVKSHKYVLIENESSNASNGPNLGMPDINQLEYNIPCDVKSLIVKLLQNA